MDCGRWTFLLFREILLLTCHMVYLALFSKIYSRYFGLYLYMTWLQQPKLDVRKWLCVLYMSYRVQTLYLLLACCCSLWVGIIVVRGRQCLPFLWLPVLMSFCCLNLFLDILHMLEMLWRISIYWTHVTWIIKC